MQAGRDDHQTIMSTPPPKPSGAERRVQPRRVLRVQAELHIAGRPPMSVRTMDISEGGLSVLCLVSLPAHTECVVHLPLPVPPSGRKPLKLRAIVLYSILSSGGGGFQLGMSTPNLDDATRAAILLYIKN